MMTIYKWFGGTSRFYAFWFFVIGAALTFMGKLTGEYLGLAGGLQTLILLHSAKEDYHERNMPK